MTYPSGAFGFTRPSKIIANQVIIEGPGDSLLVYSGTPAFGNLIASISPNNFTDAEGNAVLQGITSYFVSLSVLAVNLLGDDITWFGAATAAGPYGSEETIDFTTDSILLSQMLQVTGNLSVLQNLVVHSNVYTAGVTKLVSGTLEVVHPINAGFPAGWTGTVSYWFTDDGVSPRVAMDFHLTIANGTVVTNNEDLLVAVGSAYHFTDNKFVWGQVNGGGLVGSQHAPMRVASTGELFYDGPAFTAAGQAFFYGGSPYAVGV